ncbi:MAG TPA: hypothetical protein VN238_01970 [Solirubrobacteraceae bacterium]|nr:hypothetical protein [Solirubrobacteraceae bacterium]
MDEAEVNLDLDDVLDNEYQAFDSRGLALVIEQAPGMPFSAAIRPDELVPTHAEDLRAALVSALERTGADLGDLASQPLPRVLEVALLHRRRHSLP